MNDATPWPDNLEAYKARVAQLEVAIDAKDTTLIAMQERIVALEQQIALKEFEMREWLRRLFEKRSERYLDNPSQLKLDFPEVPGIDEVVDGLQDALSETNTSETSDPASEIVISEHTRSPHRPRKVRNEQLPEYLPRYEVEAAVPDQSKTCPRHGEKKRIGHDRIETLEFEPPKLKVRVTLIPKFACPADGDCGVSEGIRPPGLVEGNRYDTSIAAEIVTAKYGYHLPYYRQQDWFAGSGWCPSRGTLIRIAQGVGELIRPFIEYLKGEVLSDRAIGTDDTSVTLLLPHGDTIPPPGPTQKSQRVHEVFSKALAEGKRSVTANMWVYRAVTRPLNVFDFTVSRHRDGPDAFLVDTNFTGTLMADCYSGYQGITLRSEERIVRAACNAHARRKFFDAKENHPLLANQFLALYQQLYDLEDQAKALSVEERQLLRREKGEPIWRQFRALLDGDIASKVLPKEKIREAMNYLDHHWIELRRYLVDGTLPCDNNLVEQLMKQVAVGRKNWLFIGGIAAGERAANFLTLISSAMRNDLDVFRYLKGVFDALLSGSTDYAALRPDHWATAHPEQIRAYRQQERRDRQDRKSTHRNRRRK